MKFRSLSRVALVVLGFLSVGPLARGEAPSPRVQVALERLSSVSERRIRGMNEGFAEFRTRNRIFSGSLEFSDVGELTFSIEDVEERIRNLERYQGILEKNGLLRARDAVSRPPISPSLRHVKVPSPKAEIASLKRTLADYIRERQKLLKQGHTSALEVSPEVIQSNRTRLQGKLTDAVLEATQALTPAEAVSFMEEILTRFELPYAAQRALNRYNLFGSDTYDARAVVTELRLKVLDALAAWGTEAAWKVIARSTASRSRPVEMAATAYLFRDNDSEKAKALESLGDLNPLVSALRETLAGRPPTYGHGRSVRFQGPDGTVSTIFKENLYVDLQSPGGPPQKYDAIKGALRRRQAKQRFVPLAEVTASTEGLRQALALPSRRNRFAAIPARFRPTSPRNGVTSAPPFPEGSPADSMMAAAPPQATREFTSTLTTHGPEMCALGRLTVDR